MPDLFLDNPTWAVNGFVSQEDEAAMQEKYVESLGIVNMFYAYNLPFDGRQIADESFGGESFQYIPTEVQVGAAIAMRNMMEANELPIQSNDPGMTQLLQSLYQNTTSFWQNIRQAAGTGW